MHLADGFLRDFMFSQADDDRDGNLSEDEIAWFYEHILQYAHLTAAFFGNRFIAIADTDGDFLLDRDGMHLTSYLIDVENYNNDSLILNSGVFCIELRHKGSSTTCTNDSQ